MKKLKGSWLQIILCIGLPVLFLMINALVVVNHLSTNSIPLDDSLLSEDYAMLFSNSYSIAVLVCAIINVVFVLAMVFLNMNSKAMWWVYLVINLAVASFFVYRFNYNYPSDSDTFTLTTIMYLLLYFITHFISSIFTCSDYKHFNPIARFVRR